jgi:hypothetical protein
MARKAGLGEFGKQRISEEIATVPATMKQQGRQKVHAGAYVLDEAFNEEAHDLGPWIETPKSSRVEAFRYDYLNNALQVTWRNNNNHGYIYLEVPYEAYRSMARVSSKGRYVGVIDKQYDYRLMTPDELQAASNSERQSLTSRVR